MTTKVSISRADLDAVMEIDGVYTDYTLTISSDGTGRVTALDRGVLVELGTLVAESLALRTAADKRRQEELKTAAELKTEMVHSLVALSLPITLTTAVDMTLILMVRSVFKKSPTPEEEEASGVYVVDLSLCGSTTSTNRDYVLGIEAQRGAIERWAKTQCVTIVAVFEDHVSGGAELDRRPGYGCAIVV